MIGTRAGIRFVMGAALAAWSGMAQAEIAIQEVTSPGGIQAWLVEEHSIPFVSLEIRIVGGASLDRPGRRGAINLMTGLLEEGSGDLDARTFQATREGLAASFGYDVGDDRFSLSFQALTENRDEALALFRASILDPTFADDAVERVRAQVIAGIEGEAQRPNSISGDRFFADAFAGHPYGSDMNGTLDSVAALTRDDLVQAHRDVLTRDQIFVGAVGDITAEELGVILDDLLGDLPMAQTQGGDLVFFDAEVRRLDAAVGEAEAAVLAFEQEHAGALPETMTAMLSQVAAAQSQVAALTAQAAQLEALAGSAGDDAAAQSPEEMQLQALRDQLAALSLTLSENHPRVALVTSQIEALEAVVASMGETAEVSDTAALVEMQVAEIRGQIEAATAEIDALQARINAMPANGIMRATLERRVEAVVTEREAAIAARADALVANRGPLAIEFGLEGGVTVVDYPTPQSVALFGHAGLQQDDEDFFAAYILNHILGGGGFESRLMQEVREERGLTYGIGTYLVPKDHAEMILGSIASSNGTMAEAIEVIRAEWALMAAQGVTQAEMDAAKTYLTGEYPLRFDGNGPIADIMVGMQVQGLPVDYIANRNDYVNAVTLEDLNRVAAELLDAEALHFVVVGQPEGLESSE